MPPILAHAQGHVNVPTHIAPSTVAINALLGTLLISSFDLSCCLWISCSQHFIWSVEWISE